MVQQAETNEELVETLGTVKDANKRLLEQIRFQTDEIAQLTELRLNDEEQMDHLARKHRSDHESCREAAERQVAAVRSACSDQCNALRWRVADRQKCLRTR